MAERAELTENDGALVLAVIGRTLDKPSVYMSGPSKRSQRYAIEVLEALKYEGFVVVRDDRAKREPWEFFDGD